MLALWLSTLVCLAICKDAHGWKQSRWHKAEGLKAAALPSSPPGGRQDDYLDPHCGGRQVIVQLFEWRWIDVAAECERFLGRNEFCGVQVSPPNEHALVDSPPAPWWQRYQAVSYKLQSDSGTESEFISMVNICKATGVRIYVDAVFNNMAEVGRFGKGSAGSGYDSDFREFPAVPYGLDDFHDVSSCPSKNTFVNDYNNPDEVRNCSYIGRTDLDQSTDHVREKVSEYLNRLIQLGVAGFRIDLAKFMWPRDLQAIQKKLTDLPEGGRPFIYHHVENYGDDVIKTSEYTNLGYVTEFRYGQFLARAMTKGLDNLLGIQGVAASDHALVFVDNHDTQRKHQVGVPQMSFKKPKLYTMATAFTLAFNYGFVRLMSSYNFTDADAGPPRKTTAHNDVPILGDGSCGGGWVCEHRWPEIVHMVHFRNRVNGTDVNHWTDNSDFVAFSRGDVGFFAMTSKRSYVGDVETGLPPGRYCDVISQCQRTVTVDSYGSVRLDLDENVNPILAILSDWTASDSVVSNLLPRSSIDTSPATQASDISLTDTNGATAVLITENSHLISMKVPSQAENSHLISTIVPSHAENSHLISMIVPSHAENSHLISMIVPSQAENSHLISTIVPSRAENSHLISMIVPSRAENDLMSNIVPTHTVNIDLMSRILATSEWYQYSTDFPLFSVAAGINNLPSSYPEAVDSQYARSASSVDISRDLLQSVYQGQGSWMDDTTNTVPYATRLHPSVDRFVLIQSDIMRSRLSGPEASEGQSKAIYSQNLGASQSDLRFSAGKSMVMQTAFGSLDSGMQSSQSHLLGTTIPMGVTMSVEHHHYLSHSGIDSSNSLGSHVHTPVLQSSVLQSSVLQSSVLHTPVLQSSVLQSSVLHTPVLQSSVLQSSVLQSPVVPDSYYSPRPSATPSERPNTEYLVSWSQVVSLAVTNRFSVEPTHALPLRTTTTMYALSSNPYTDYVLPSSQVAASQANSHGNSIEPTPVLSIIPGTVTYPYSSVQESVTSSAIPCTSVHYAAVTTTLTSSDMTSATAEKTSSMIAGTDILQVSPGTVVTSSVMSSSSLSATLEFQPTSTIARPISVTTVTEVLPASSSTPTTMTSPLTTPTTSVLTTSSPYKRTVVLLHWRTNVGEYVFFRGGIDGQYRDGCVKDAESDPCAIPIRDRDEGTSRQLDEYNAWRRGDSRLDWYGAESEQGRFQGREAQGSPGIWTTNVAGQKGYSKFNRYGEHYWLLDVDMDCSQTENGFFEVKGFSTTSQWERGIMEHACSGSGSYPPPPAHGSTNHFARCGYVNVFRSDGNCEVNSFEEYQAPDVPIIG